VRTDPVDVTVPGDKSITHRALILAALADGESRLSGLLDAADTRATARALRALGVPLSPGTLGEVRVVGRGVGGLEPPAGPLDCGNSGTTARLLFGALAGCPFEATITGDDSLRHRPMRRVTEPLAIAGAAFRELSEPDRLPICVRGERPLRPVAWRSPQASAQVKSALLLAGVTGRTTVQVTEPVRSRDHTERMLQSMGARVRTGVDETSEGGGDRPSPAAPTDHVVALDPPERLTPLELHVPGDISTAAFFLALGALVGAVRVQGVGLNPGRTGVLRVLERMGAAVSMTVEAHDAGEPVGSVVVAPETLRGARIARHEVPSLLDEIPVLAILAARADGETRFDGIGELRVKESDRVAALSDNLRRLGVNTEAGPDHLAVAGTVAPLVGSVDARGDHRIAMAFGVLGALEGNRIEVRGGDVVAVSFPAFWQRLDQVREELRQR
jgi:3-phosphoshikimate 1-carboxyvinyltransferase